MSKTPSPTASSSSPKGQKFLRSRFEAYNRLQAAAVAFGESIAIPEIVAIGGQSDGKSSLLEALLGFRFNVREVEKQYIEALKKQAVNEKNQEKHLFRVRIREAELKEEEKLHLEGWKRMVSREKSYIEGWKRWLEGENKTKEADISFVRGMEGLILEEEKMLIKARKEFIAEHRRWVLEEEDRITKEKEVLEEQKNAPFASFSRDDQAYNLQRMRDMVIERKGISEEEKAVVEMEKRVMAEEKRFMAEEKKIEMKKMVVKQKTQVSWASITKEEKEKIVKQSLFVHPKVSRPPVRQNIPEWKKSQNLDQSITRGKNSYVFSNPSIHFVG